jgi:hypothetical protein
MKIVKLLELSGRAPLVAMMEAADFRDGNDVPGIGRLNWPRFARVLFQGKVRSAFVVTGQVTRQSSSRRRRVENDHMIEARAAN